VTGMAQIIFEHVVLIDVFNFIYLYTNPGGTLYMDMTIVSNKI